MGIQGRIIDKTVFSFLSCILRDFSLVMTLLLLLLSLMVLLLLMVWLSLYPLVLSIASSCRVSLLVLLSLRLLSPFVPVSLLRLITHRAPLAGRKLFVRHLVSVCCCILGRLYCLSVCCAVLCCTVPCLPLRSCHNLPAQPQFLRLLSCFLLLIHERDESCQ